MRTLALCCLLSCAENALFTQSCGIDSGCSAHKLARIVASRRSLPPTACAAGAALANLEGLQREAQRKLSRARKQLAKAEERATACEEQQEELLAQARLARSTHIASLISYPGATC